MAELTSRRAVIGAGLALALSGPALAQGQGNRRALVVYHSRTGHTRTIAEIIQRRTGADLVEIETVERYPDDYDALVAQNQAEQQSGFLPPLRTRVENLADYDVVFIGSPLWNVRLTPPMRSFLFSHDLAGKVVAPFTTYIVSGLGRAHDDIAGTAPQAQITEGLAILGEEAASAESAVADWLVNLQFYRRTK